MKKLLTILSISTITITTSSNLISCKLTKLNIKKISLDNFKLKDINLNDITNIANYNVIMTIYNQMAIFTKTSADMFNGDNHIVINVIDANNNAYTNSTSQDPNITYKTAVSGKTKVSIAINNDRYFSLSKTLNFTINLKVRQKVNIDNFKLQDINMYYTKKQNNFELLDNIYQQIADYGNVPYSALVLDGNIHIYVVEQDKTNFNTDVLDANILLKKACLGNTKVSLSISNDKYLILDKKLNFNIKVFDGLLNYY